MPLQTLPLPASVHKRLTAKLRLLIRSGDLEIPDGQGQPGFCMAIQLVPKRQLRSLAFGRPEGLRMFVETNNKIAAALDFLYAGNRVKLAQVYQGQGLYELLNALNKLEKKYARDKTVFHVQLISFLLAPGFYLLAISKKGKQFYHASPKKLTALSARQLQTQIGQLIQQRSGSL